MEVLKVMWFLPAAANQFSITAGTNASLRTYLTTRSNGTTEPILQTSGGVIAFKSIYVSSIAASTDSANISDFSTPIDLTDGVGHGVLVATDQLFIGAIQSAAASPITGSDTISVRILYRWKDVSVTEYIGIVQSQT